MYVFMCVLYDNITYSMLCAERNVCDGMVANLTLQANVKVVYC